MKAGFNQPNFFILGAAKSATTSLYFYLKQHPDVFMCPGKEPNFFSEGFQTVSNPVDYYRLYDGVEGQSAIGEASHAYLTNPSSARLLKTLYPRARFVVVLRDPVDRAYSLYHHMRRRGLEPLGTFEAALAAEEGRFADEAFRRTCPHYLYNFLYVRSGLYGEQLERFFALFEPAQFFICTFNDVTRRHAATMAKLYAFLGVDPGFVPALAVHNQGGKTDRFPWLHHTLEHVIKPRRPLYPAYRILNRVFRPGRLVPIPPLAPATRDALAQRFRDDQALLRRLTGVALVPDEGSTAAGPA